MSDNPTANPVPTDADTMLRKPRYTLAELLDLSDYSQPQPADEKEWGNASPVGRELI